ncbi:endospore germination permease [Brevibacillus sp. GCM10020057]|uniref:GerAB/ArcD/ProY family transporter n=1 Tax=Brevibacillus sp. GCM10020057 TaxID=3317327 RepID=UPI003635223E
MQSGERISATQTGMLLYPSIMATAMIAGPSVMARKALNDMWLSPIWASISGFLAIFIACRLYKRHPNMNIIQQSAHIAGAIPGKIIGFYYFFIFLQINGSIVRDYAEFIGLFLRDTPMSVISMALILVSAVAVTGGIEVIARSGQIFSPFFVGPFVIMILLVLKDMEPQNMLPILENGLLPTFRGAVTPQGWFSEAFLITFLLPVLKEKERGGMAGHIAVFFSMITMVIANLVTLFLMGEITSALLFPIMDIARYVSIADFFENLESGVMAIWVVGAFIKVSLFYYASAQTAAHWLQLSSYRVAVLPIGWLTVLFSFWGLPNFTTYMQWSELAIPVSLFLSFVVFPGCLLLISAATNKGSAKQGGIDKGNSKEVN